MGRPFHKNPSAPPPIPTAAAKSTGSDFSSSTASITFDFPDPFGPISTFSPCNSIASLPGAKERKLSRRRLLRKGGFKGRVRGLKCKRA